VFLRLMPATANMHGFGHMEDLLPEAILLVQADGLLLEANAAAARLFDCPASELSGQRLHDWCGQDLARLEVILHLGSCTPQMLPGELTLRLPGGIAVCCRSESALYQARRGDAPAQIMLRLTPQAESSSRFLKLSEQVEVLSQDIGRRRRVEAALFEERERLRITLASIADAVIVTDTDGLITFMNGVAETLTGWAGDEAGGRPIDDVFVIVHHDTRAPVESLVAKVLSEGVVVGLPSHTVLVNRSGAELPIDDSGAPVRDDQGRMIGVVMVFRDVSERNALEHALRRQAELLVSADRRKDEFLAMLAHELRNPLAPLSNGVSLLRMRGNEDPQTATIALMMERQLHHLTRLVNDLLDVSRITRGLIVLQRKPIELSAAISLAVELAQPLIDDHLHELLVELPPQPVRLEADITRIAQVIANLLANAAKYTPKGGRIELRCSVADGHLRIGVRDNGIGLPPELTGKVFDLFQQADRALDRSQGGLGIGLTVARAMVEMHGGSVAAHSEGVGRGSEFVVCLPLFEAQAPAQLQPPPLPALDPPPITCPGVRVLVVDDNLDSAGTLCVLLEHWGHPVKVVHCGNDAIAAFAAFDPDVVLLDIGLPGMDGYEIARRLRRLPRQRPLRLIAVTGYGRDEDRRKSDAAGFDLHLLKPLDLDALQELLEAG
jgi:PAS domain S-box-containing protein